MENLSKLEIRKREQANIAAYNALPKRPEHAEVCCPACGSFEYDTTECAECGFNVYEAARIRRRAREIFTHGG